MIEATSSSSSSILVIYLLVFFAVYYFISRPRRKRKQAAARAQEQTFQVAQNNIASQQSVTAPEIPKPEIEIATNAARLEDLAKIADLRDKGILTEQEFQAQKNRILGR